MGKMLYSTPSCIQAHHFQLDMTNSNPRASQRKHNSQRAKKDKNGTTLNNGSVKTSNRKNDKSIRGRVELFNDIKQYYPNDVGSMFAVLPEESNIYYCQHYTKKTGYCNYSYTFEPDTYIGRNSRNEPLEQHLTQRHGLTEFTDKTFQHHLDSRQESAFEFQTTHFKIWSKVSPITFGLIFLYLFDISYRFGIMYGLLYAGIIFSFVYYFLLSVEALTFFVTLLSIWLMYYFPSQLRIILVALWAMVWLLRDILHLLGRFLISVYAMAK